MTILLDMDGVLCNFEAGADKVHDVELDWTKWSGGLGPSAFWKPIHNAGMDFWHNLEQYSWTELLIDGILAHFDDVYICTSPALEPCASGKIQWMQDHLPDYLHRRFILTSHKHLMANESTVLVDDSDHNGIRFSKAGGHVVLFPQRWNKASSMLPMSDETRVHHVLASIYQIERQ